MDRTYSLGGIVTVIAVAIVCAIAAPRAQPQVPADSSLTQELLASDLIGRPVRSANGEDVGEIADLVLSPADRVTSAVVSVGGFLGLGDRRVEVPYDKLIVAANRSTVLVTLTKEQVVANPEFSSDDYKPKHDAGAASPGARVAPPAEQPDAAARSAANAEAAQSFATDDPRVAQGIAENKEAYERKNEAQR